MNSNYEIMMAHCRKVADRRTGKATDHYTYFIEDVETGNYYVGVRSCACSPESDTQYMGSGWWPKAMRKAGHGHRLHKHIIATYTTREAADVGEADLIRFRGKDSQCMNRASRKMSKRQRKIQRMLKADPSITAAEASKKLKTRFPVGPGQTGYRCNMSIKS
jgi:hypothetical protein